MENTPTALDFIRAQREVLRTSAAPLNKEEEAALTQPQAHVAEFTDTVMFRSPVIDIDQEKCERERILSPGATGPIGAAYKMLRTQVLRRMEQIGANTLAVLSPTAGAGKTLSAINLAIAIAAEPGRTVLLADLDLRNPSVHRRFDFTPEIGVEDCIESNRPVQEAMVKIRGYDRLTVLPARARVEHSSELLSDRRTADMIIEMRTRYANRILVFDLPPVLQADDVLAFTRNVQAGLVVVNEGHTRREDVVRTIGLLHDLKIVGTVLNASREPVKTYY